MEKPDLIRDINVSLIRLGLYFSEDIKEFLWCLQDESLVLILRFLSRVSKYYRKAK